MKDRVLRKRKTKELSYFQLGGTFLPLWYILPAMLKESRSSWMLLDGHGSSFIMTKEKSSIGIKKLKGTSQHWIK